MNDHADSGAVSHGVEALIERLRDEGVAAGRSEAERIVAEAQARADWIVNQAKEEAARNRDKAYAAAERAKTAGEQALRMAFRDAVLTLKDNLTRRFREEIQRLVAQQLKDEELLRRLILEIAGRIREGIDDAQPIELLLPRDVIGLEDLRRHPEELDTGPLTHFVLAVAGDVLRQGVIFGVADDGQGGIQVRLGDDGIVLDLSDKAFAELLLQHLQPRFRALLEGAVR